MEAHPFESWPPASRRRRWLAAYIDFLVLGPPLAVVLWALSAAFPWIKGLWFPLQLLLFLVIEALLLGLARWSPGWKALGIELRPDVSGPIDPETRKGWLVVNPWLLANERWWTILPGVLMVLDGAKLIVRWTQWSRTMPFFGVLLEGGAAVPIQVALGVLEVAAGVGVLRLRRWGVWAGIAFQLLVLTSFATSGAVIPEYVEREFIERRAATGREVGADEIRLAQTFLPAGILAFGAVMVLWLGIVAVRVRAAWRSR